jgi:hypothetical protein
VNQARPTPAHLYESTVGGERPISAGRADQGDWLVHAACWRADPKPFDRPPVD